jgi:hypothetical protein
MKNALFRGGSVEKLRGTLCGFQPGCQPLE